MERQDIVAQHQAHRVIADELLANDKRLRQSVGRRLLGILEAHAIVRPIAQQPLEAGQVRRCGDNQYLPNARQHQHRYGVIHHRFVIHRQQLFAHSLGNGVQARSAATR